MNRSAAMVSISARRIASAGIAWPNEIVAVLTKPPQASQSGAVSSRSKAWRSAVELVARAAIEAVRVGRVAVQFDDAIPGDAGGLMQPVDVLGDDRRRRAAADQRSDRAMAAVGRRGAKGLLHRKAPAPGLAARLLRGEKIGEIDRRHLGPDAAGAAEIGDARFGADAGAGKDDGAARLARSAGRVRRCRDPMACASLSQNSGHAPSLGVRDCADHEGAHRLSRRRGLHRRTRRGAGHRRAGAWAAAGRRRTAAPGRMGRQRLARSAGDRDRLDLGCGGETARGPAQLGGLCAGAASPRDADPGSNCPRCRRKPLVFGMPAPAAPLGSWTLLDAGTLLASPHCTSPFPNGEVHFVEDRAGPPSRAYLKLWEALTLIGRRPQPGETCLDLGSSPGGWSWACSGWARA